MSGDDCLTDRALAAHGVSAAIAKTMLNQPTLRILISLLRRGEL